MSAGVVRRRLPVRGPLLVLVTVVVGLMFPAGAMAYDHVITTAGVAKKDGFKLSLNIRQSCFPGCDEYGVPSVTGVLMKKRGHVTQTVSYGFFFGAVKFKNRNLSWASVKGSFANRRRSSNMPFHASINMTFHATGPVIHSCSRIAGRRGVLEGTYTLRAGKYFGKVTQKSFTATLWNGDAGACGPPPRVDLVTQGDTSAPYVAVSKSRAGDVSEAIGVAKGVLGGNNRVRWGIAYSYSVAGEPARDYKVGPKLRSATVTGAVGISGTATYSAQKANARQSTGTLSGSLAATIAGIGRVRPFAKGPQSAVQRLSGAV